MNLKNILTMASLLMMFVISSIMGFLGLAAEMGIAVAAGALGLSFVNLDKFKKFSGAGFSAEMIENVFEKNQEAADVVNNDEYSKNVHLIGKALIHPKYNWRTLKGIARDIGLSQKEVWSCLMAMYQDNLVKSGNKADGKMVWGATEKLKHEINKSV